MTQLVARSILGIAAMTALPGVGTAQAANGDVDRSADAAVSASAAWCGGLPNHDQLESALVAARARP